MPTTPRWAPFSTSAFAFFTVMSGTTIPTPLYPIYADRFGFSPFVITLIFAAYAGGVLAALLGTGPWSDQLGRKPMLLAGLGCAVLSVIAFVAAQGLPLLLVARVCQGLAAGIYASAATVAVTELAPEGHERLGGLGATAANMGGLGTGPILGGAAAALLPAPLIVPYLLHLSMVAIALLALRSLPETGQPVENPRLRPQGLDVPEEVRGLFLPAALGAFAIFMICGFLGAVAPSYLGEVLGRKGDHILIGFAAGAIFLASIPGQALESRLPDGIALPLGVGLMTVGIAAITGAFAVQSLVGLLAAILFAGIGHGIAFRAGLSAITERAPEGHSAAVTATYFTVVYVAISIPVLIIGALQKPVGLQPVTLGYAAFSTLLSAAALILLLRRRGQN